MSMRSRLLVIVGLAAALFVTAQTSPAQAGHHWHGGWGWGGYGWSGYRSWGGYGWGGGYRGWGYGRGISVGFGYPGFYSGYSSYGWGYPGVRYTYGSYYRPYQYGIGMGYGSPYYSYGYPAYGYSPIYSYGSLSAPAYATVSYRYSPTIGLSYTTPIYSASYASPVIYSYPAVFPGIYQPYGLYGAYGYSSIGCCGW